jgi:hypothetical protein
MPGRFRAQLEGTIEAVGTAPSAALAAAHEPQAVSPSSRAPLSSVRRSDGSPNAHRGGQTSCPSDCPRLGHSRHTLSFGHDSSCGASFINAGSGAFVLPRRAQDEAGVDLSCGPHGEGCASSQASRRAGTASCSAKSPVLSG